jgi:cytochrome c6
MKKAVIILTLVLGLTSIMFAADGAAIYKAKCAMCHGADGSKSNPSMKALNSADVQKQTDAQLTEITSKGKGKMPGYSGKLSDDEIKAVVSFLRTLK